MTTPLKELGITAVAIVCVPAELRDRHFMPAASLINTSLGGVQEPHPITQLATLFVNLKRSFLIIVDDLAVSRSWMLPDVSSALIEESIDRGVQILTSYAATHGACRVQRLTDFLQTQGAVDLYENRLIELAATIQENLAHVECEQTSCEQCQMRALYVRDIARRKAFFQRQGIRRRLIRREYRVSIHRLAALQLANYAVQGELLDDLQLPTYVAQSLEEVLMMSISRHDPSWQTSLVSDFLEPVGGGDSQKI